MPEEAGHFTFNRVEALACIHVACPTSPEGERGIAF
jgi:hypothetical protein